MRMKMRVTPLLMLVFVVCLPFPSQTVALALSDVELQSHLNQRLSARIRLLDVPTRDLGDLSISVSEIADAVVAGRHTQLSHEVVIEGSTYYLMITSRDTIREPIFSFLVELNWPAGHLLRNYALIIDPQ